MTTTGDLGPLASSGRETVDYEGDKEENERAIAYLACPVCRGAIPLPAGELPPLLTCEQCGAMLER